MTKPRDAIADALARTARDLADQLWGVRSFFAGANLAPALSGIAAHLAKSSLDVEILVTAAGEPAWKAIAGAQPDLRMTIATADRPAVAAVGTPQAAVLIAAASAAGGADLPAWYGDRPLVIRLNPGAPGAARQGTGWCEVDVTGEPGAVMAWLAERAASGLWRTLVCASGARALSGAARAIAMEAEAEIRALRCRRALLTQSVAAASPHRAPSLDVMSELRGSLQKLFTDFTRGVEERIEVACAPDGPVTTAILHDMERALSLTETPQARSILVRIAPESERRTLDAIASRFREHARSDVTAANDLLRMSASEAAAVFDARGLAAPVPEFKPFDGVALEQLLARQVAFQRQYIGTLPKTGPFEYVMIARRYQMMLFMFISAFGLSFLRTYREFMVPSAVLLLSLGAVNVWLSVRREHVEDRLRERDKARELLRTDIRRLLSELERGWTNAVNGALTAALADYAAQLNAVVADAETHRLGRLQDVRHAQQRQIQGAESVERRLVALQKAATMAEASVAQACGEIRQLLRSAIAGGPA